MKNNSLDEQSSVNAILQAIGKKLTELRIQKGYKSHADFSAVHDLPKIQYWRMEKGKANVTLKSLSKVTAIHQMPLEKFFKAILAEGERHREQV
jgi:hypothetical protein